MPIIDLNEVPSIVDVVVRVGNVYRDSYTLEHDPDGTIVALSIANATFTGGIATGEGEAATLALVEVDDYAGNSGIIIDSGAAGQFTVWVKGADTTTLQATSKRMTYWIKATWTPEDSTMPNVVKTLLAGKFLIPD